MQIVSFLSMAKGCTDLRKDNVSYFTQTQQSNH